MVCAAEAQQQLGLDRVLMVVASVPPHKGDGDDPGAEHRLQMCRLIATDHPWLEVSELELQRSGPSYTVDTLREIHASAPGDELTLILGADAALGLPDWREPEGVLELAALAIVDRTGIGLEALREHLSRLHGGERLTFIDAPPIGISSSLVRERVAAGRSVAHLVGRDVAAYIDAQGLYR